MKKYLSGCVLGACLMATPVMADGLKIGVVNVRQLMSQSPQAEHLEKTLEKEFAPRKNNVLDLQKKLQDRVQKYQKEAPAMSDSERKKTEKEITEKQRDLQRMEQEFREDLQARQREETEKMLKKLSEAINSFAARDGYDLILNNEATPFVASKIDITKPVLDELKKHK